MKLRYVDNGLLIVTLGLPMAMLGTVHTKTMGVALLLGAIVFVRLATMKRIRLDVVGWVLLGMIAMTLLQILPLPAALVKLLSPAAYAVRADALAPLNGEVPAWMSLSIDVSVTVEELAKLMLYLGGYWLCLQQAKRHGGTFVLKIVAAIGAAGALVFLLHKIAMIDRVYGIYTPIDATPRGDGISAPLINTNHMAGFLLLCACVTIGLAASRGDRIAKLTMVTIAGIVGGTLLLTLSRGGIVAFVVGQIVFICGVWIQKRLRRRNGELSHRGLAWVPLGLALSLGLGMFAAQDAIVGEFYSGDYRKIEMLAEAFPLMKQFPLFGTGRGTFYLGFPLISDWSAQRVFTHAENAIVQLLVDYGVVMGPLFLLGFGLTVARRLFFLPSRTAHLGAIVGLAALGFHNFVDFNLEIPGVALLAIAVLAATGSQGQGKAPARRGLRHRMSFTLPPLIPAVGTGVSVGLAVVCFVYLPTHSLIAAEQRALTALERRDTAYFETDNLAREMGRHPASHYLPFIAGVQRVYTGKGNPLPFLGQALRLKPSAAGAHFYIGAVLLEGERYHQALLEFRLAALFDNRLIRPIVSRLVETIPRFDILHAIAVDASHKRLLYEPLAQALDRNGHATDAEAADKSLLRLATPTVGAIQRQTRRLARRGHIEAAFQMASRLKGVAEFPLDEALLKATIHQIAGNDAQELETLQAVEREAVGNREYYRRLAYAYFRNGMTQPALDAMSRYKTLATDIPSRAHSLKVEGDLFGAMGKHHTAHKRYRQASSLAPRNRSVLIQLYKTAKVINNMDSVLNTLYMLERLEPQNQQWSDERHRIEHSRASQRLERSFTHE